MRTASDVVPALTVLTRVAQDEPEGRRHLARALRGRLERVGEAAVQVAAETGQPMGEVLAAALKEHPEPGLFFRLAEVCGREPYRHSTHLASVALAVLDRCVESLPDRSDDHETERVFCRWLNDRGSRRLQVGQRDEAVSDLREAARRRSRLAACTGSREDRLGHARSLSNLAQATLDVGRRGRSLVIGRRAVAAIAGSGSAVAADLPRLAACRLGELPGRVQGRRSGGGRGASRPGGADVKVGRLVAFPEGASRPGGADPGGR